ARDAAAEDRAERTLLLRADWVYDDAVIRSLAAARDDIALIADDGSCIAVNVGSAQRETAHAALDAQQVPSGVRAVRLGELADAYNDTLRKREPPFLMRLSAEALPAIERRIFGASYKGVTDLVTLYLWPAP